MKILATCFVKGSMSKIQVQPLHGTYNSGLHKITFTAIKFTYNDLEVNYIYNQVCKFFTFWNGVKFTDIPCGSGSSPLLFSCFTQSLLSSFILVEHY